MLIAVVLGNRMNDDGTLSKIALERIDLAESLYKELKPDKMILSGGVGLADPDVIKTTEADAMYQEIVRRGVIDKDIIILEKNSKTTKQNALYSVKIANELGVNKMVVCTSREHAERRYLNPLKLFRRAVRKSRHFVPVEIYTK